MADKPGHVLEIPESLGRDVDKAREGKIPAPPIEAFLSPGALEQAEKMTSAEPVHAEDLVPISKAEAARRTTFDGEHLPAVPTTRRVIPPPFRRQRISIDHHGKTWQSVRADQVLEGDIVPDLGRVAEVAEAVLYSPRRDFLAPGQREQLTEDELDEPVAHGMAIRILGAGANVLILRPDMQVRVFRA